MKAINLEATPLSTEEIKEQQKHFEEEFKNTKRKVEQPGIAFASFLFSFVAIMLFLSQVDALISWKVGIILGALVAVVLGVIYLAFIPLEEIRSFKKAKKSTEYKEAISLFKELNPETHTTEYITLDGWADNDEVVKHFLKQIVDLNRKPTLGEYQAILTWVEEKPIQEQKLSLQKQAHKSAEKLGFS